MTTLTEAVSQPTLSFPDASSLDLLVPDSSDFDIEAHLKSDSQFVSRDILLFGMRLFSCLYFSIFSLMFVRGIAACISCPSQLIAFLPTCLAKS